MPLTFNHEAIPEAVKFRPGTTDLTVVTQLLIHATENIGMPRITEATAAEFYARLRMVELVFGAYQHNSEGEPEFIQPGEVAAHIGLRTNALTQSATAFRNHFWKQATEKLNHQYTIGNYQAEAPL